MESNYDACCAESNNKKNYSTRVNPNLMIGEKKLVMTKCRGLHCEPMIDPSTPSFDLEWPNNHYCNICNNVEMEVFFCANSFAKTLNFYETFFNNT